MTAVGVMRDHVVASLFVRAGHKLCMLGYGNLAALVNDPRVNPRAWQQGNDVGAEEGGQQQQQEPPHRGANCVVGG